MRLYFYDTVRHEPIPARSMQHVPRIGEYVLLLDGRTMIVTRVVYDLQDELVRVYLDSAPL